MSDRLFKISINDDKTAKTFSKDSQKRPFILDMKNSFITNNGLRYLSDSTNSSMIREINLADNFSSINDNAVISISKSQNMSNVRKLNLKDSDITDNGLVELIFAPNFESIEELIMYGVLGMSDLTLFALSDSCFVKNLIKLDLRCTNISDKGIEIISNSPNFKNIRELDLSDNTIKITDASLIAIGMSEYINKLEVFKCCSNKISDKGLEYFLDSKNIRNLQILEIAETVGKMNANITDYTMKILAKSDFPKRLETLNLRSTGISNDGVKEYFLSYNCRNLKILRISHNMNINDKALVALANSENLGNLEKLYINDTNVSNEGVEGLLKMKKALNIIF